jgi:hypothetical protein
MKKENLSELEQKFENAINEGKVKIQHQLDIAYGAIRKAEKLSEEYGIPFYAGCSPLSQQYFPESYDEKWGLLSEETLEEFGYSKNEYGNTGWEHSAVC